MAGNFDYPTYDAEGKDFTWDGRRYSGKKK